MEAIIAKLKIQKAALVAEVGRIDAAIAALSGGTTPTKVSKRRKKATGRKRRKMTDAERRAVSMRMKESWAKRKKKSAGK